MADVRVNPLTLSTVWHSFQNICKEMRHVIDRTSQNYLIAQLHDVSVGIWDGAGRTVAIPIGLSVQYLGGKLSVEYVLNKFKGNLNPGDVILVNDPYHGYCCHLPDWGFYRPIFYKGELLFFTLCRAHQMDTGGAYPGGYFPNAYDIHAEGLCIPGIKVMEGDKEREDVMELILNNVRWPQGTRIDNYAQIAATRLCEQRIVGLLDKYGKETVLACVEEMMARTEKAVRSAIEKIPDGTYYGEAATDDDGTELDVPVWVRCDITVKGDTLKVDFSKSDKQRKGFVNCVFNSTFSNALSGLFMFLNPALGEYHNEGSLRPITVYAPPGSVLNAQYPATVGASPVSMGHQIIESVVSAMSKAVPDRAIGCWGKRYGHYIFGLDPRTNEKYVVTTFDMDGGAGAVRGFDGFEGATSIGTLGEVNKGNVEEVEMRFPWRTVCWEFATDTSGAGLWRGASGMHWEVENVGGDAGIATGSSDGELVRAPGALGGESTPNSKSFLTRNGESQRIRGHRLYELKPGDVILKISGGGAGVGNPMERDPEKVRWDVYNEFISIEKARDMYGVVIDPVTLTVDQERTKALRSQKKET
ncbi:MAG TPA: hydantoinase B/oxoprolinase family protein [bacterium]|nr:hydantoinase B/oxoprolinase family protein [bacterium]